MFRSVCGLSFSQMKGRKTEYISWDFGGSSTPGENADGSRSIKLRYLFSIFVSPAGYARGQVWGFDMLSRVVKVWPLVVIALLMVAFWCWGTSSSQVMAQTTSTEPVVTLDPEWQWMGESVTLSGEGFTTGAQIWAYVWSSSDVIPDEEVPSCATIGVDANLADSGLVGLDGTASFDIKVEPHSGFSEGDNNYLCLIDHVGHGSDVRPARLRVVVPPAVYRIKLDVTSIVEGPDSAFGGGDLPDDFEVLDGKHVENWNTPQRRGFFMAGSSDSGFDYSMSGVVGNDGVVYVPAGATDVRIPVNVVDDSVDEGLETVIMTLATGTGYTVDPDAERHTLTIQDNDNPQAGTPGRPSVTFARLSQSVDEDSGSVDVSLNLSPAPTGGFPITYLVSGTAESGSDYVALTGTVLVDSGATSVRIPVTVENDVLDEDRETLVLTLVADASYVVGATVRYTMTIVDDDDPMRVPVLIVSANASLVDEGSVVKFTVRSNRAAPTDGITVVAMVDGVLVDGLAIEEGKRSVVHEVTTTESESDESDKETTFTLDKGIGYEVGDPKKVTVQVVDKQATVVTLLRVGDGDCNVAGGVNEGAPVCFTVSLSRQLEDGEVIDVPLVLSGVSSRDVEDLELTPVDGATLIDGGTFRPVVRFSGGGAKTATLSLMTRTDSVDEGEGETLKVALGPDGRGTDGFDRSSRSTNVGGGADPASESDGNSFDVLVAELGDDGGPVITVTADSSRVTEGRVASFTIRANPAPAADLEVTLNVVDTPGSDFVGFGVEGGGNVVTIEAGATTVKFTFSTLSDLTDEASGEVEVRVVGGADYRVGSSDKLTVVDDDSTLVTLSGPTAADVDEDSEVVFTVALGRPLVAGEQLVVRLPISGEVSLNDYSLDCGDENGVTCLRLDTSRPLLEFVGPTERLGTLTFEAMLDEGVESEFETVEVGLSLVTSVGLGGGVTLSDDLGVFRVKNRQAASPVVGFDPNKHIVLEDVGTHEVVLTLSHAAPVGFAVSYTLSGSATRDASVRSGESRLVDTYGDWYRCEEREVDGVQVGCEWETRPAGNNSTDEVFLERVRSGNADLVQVPGDRVELRVGLRGQSSGVQKAAERYVAFWGPVDIWKLGAPPRGDDVVIEPQHFSIQSDHLVGIESRLVLQSDLDSDGYITLSIDRGSANRRGNTFVSLVPCNDDYLEGKFSGSGFDRAQRALRDCSEPSVTGLPLLSGGGSSGDEIPQGVVEAWSQHDVRSGLGMSCDVRVWDDAPAPAADAADDADAEPNWVRTIECVDDILVAVSEAEYDECIDVLSIDVEHEDFAGPPRSGPDLKCGRGHYRRPVGATFDMAWGATSHNAARSFYGFVLNWQRGGGNPLDLPGCDIHLLPWRLNGDDDVVGFPRYGTRYWLAGEYGAPVDEDCVAMPGEHEIDVDFYTPASDADSWSEPRQTWHDDHPVHFAVYVSGMPAVHDYTLDEGDGGGDWRRVWMGSWSVGEVGNLSTLGLAHPDVGVEGDQDGEEAADVGITLPSISEMTDGYSLRITRDYAGIDGMVRLHVVPCLPLYADEDVLEGSCEDLPKRVGDIDGVLFERHEGRVGPYGLDDVHSLGHKVLYSHGVTVSFRSSAWGDDSARPVSTPLDVQAPSSGGCGVSSLIPSGGSSTDVYWPEVTVQGGECDRSDLSSVNVSFTNVDGGSDERLVVYATGGRTTGMGMVQVGEVQVDGVAEPLGRLGVRERLMTLGDGGSDTVLVSADLADADGDVWLVGYVCGSGSDYSRVNCPRVRAGRAVPVYDVGAPVAFMVRVRFLPGSGLKHSDLGPICQGLDCEPVVPVLRQLAPDVAGGGCAVSSYTGRSSDLLYWPDRLVSGGGCEPYGLSPLSVDVSNVAGAQTQDMVVFATGGRTAGWETVQVRRGAGEDSSGMSAGAAGLRRVQLSLDGGESGQVLVGPGLVGPDGKVLLLAYLCPNGSGCPGERGDDLITFMVDRRPLFQVLVEYDPDLFSFSDFEICRGDSCVDTYSLGRVSSASSVGCSVSATYSEGQLYWPDGVLAGGGCERDDLGDVLVSFGLPSDASAGQSLTVYVTGGRTAGLGEVTVRRAASSSGSGVDASYRGYLVRDPLVVAPDPAVVDSGWNANVIPGSLLTEYNTVNMRWVQANHRDLYDILEAKAWVGDGLSDVEKSALDYLLYLAAQEQNTAAAATRVAVMPFLDEVDQADYLTLRGLNRAAAHGMVYNVIDHSTLSGGIENSERVLVMGVSAMSDSQKMASRLSSGYSNVETETYSTTRTPTLSVVVVRTTTNHQPYLADHVAAAVRAIEDVMDAPIPVSYVVLFMDSDLIVSGADGVNYGHVISYNPERETVAGTRDSDILKSGVVHEVAHYYWFGSQSWVDEGIASAFEFMLGTGFGIAEDLLRHERVGCDIPNLRSLVEAYPISLVSSQGVCDYYLGQRLFLDLRASLGDADFYAGVRRLYVAVAGCGLAVGSDECTTVDDVRAAFPDSGQIIDLHWGPVSIGPTGDERRLGRLGLRESLLTLEPGGSVDVVVSADLAAENGEVWLLAYSCVGAHGDRGCPLVDRPASNGYDLPVGPDFALRVNFTPASGLEGADLREVCRGEECDIVHPWLRRAGPDGDDCSVVLGAHWPDRVVRGGGCYLHGANYGSVNFRSDFDQKFVVYATGGDEVGLELVPVYGVVGEVAASAVDASQQLGSSGFEERRVEFAPGGEDKVWVRSDMADDDGNVWLFAYRCESAYGDAGCPLLDRDVVRPSYDIGIRPDFVVKVGFLPSADAGQSTLEVDCVRETLVCRLTATFRDADGNHLPGRVQFRVDAGTLGASGSTAQVSEHPHVGGVGSYRFEELLNLPSVVSAVNVEVELLADGRVLRGQAGFVGSLSSISASVLRCSGDALSCHGADVELADRFAPGDWFVLRVTGYDAAGKVALSPAGLTNAQCTAGPARAWPEFWLSSVALRSHGYGTSQLSDRGYAGCAMQVSDAAADGSYDVTVSHRVEVGTVSVVISVHVSSDDHGLAYLDLSGPASLESGETGTYWLWGFDAAGLPLAFASEDGCVELSLTGALEYGESGTEMDGCLAQDLPVAGVEFTVLAAEDVLYRTDSSVGVAYGGRSVRQHVLVSPADGDSISVPSVPSHITDLSIAQEDTLLKLSWTSSPTSEFESMRVQAWVQVGGADVFLPGCEGGEVLEITTYEVFCLLSYGQSEDVYHAAVGFFRWDGSAVPVATAEWTRP